MTEVGPLFAAVLLLNVYICDGLVLTESRLLRRATSGGYMIFAKRFRSQHHTRSFVVNAEVRGWEVRVEEDNEVVKLTLLHDWHRVENAMMRFTIQATQMQSAGWTEVHAPASSVV